MDIYENMQQFRAMRGSVLGQVGFVPTMGALHAGHASLLERSVAENEFTVLSIYINPTQFNDPKDLQNYPSTIDEDLALARSIGVDAVILPAYEDLYADNYRYQVNEGEFSEVLCGANRPGHFTGVLTVVMKLLNLVKPNRAYFGRKDYQQFQLIKDMAHAFFLDVDIVGCPTVRESDGLAMSSRNKLLDEDARRLAGQFNCILRRCGEDDEIAALLKRCGFEVDYVETRYGRRFGAVVMHCGSGDEQRCVRLIDNVGVAA